MVSVFDDGDIDIDDVAVFQEFVVAGNAMANDVVDRRTDRLGKTLVIQRRRDRPLLFDNMLVADSVEFAGGNAGLHMLADHFQHFRGKPAGHAHFFDLGGRFQMNGHESANQATQKLYRAL